MSLLRAVRAVLVVLVVAATVAVVSLVAAPGSAWVGGGFRLDPLRAPLLLLVTLLGATVAAYCVRNLQGQARLRRFAGLLLVAVLGLTCGVVADSVFVLAGGWVAASLAVSGLVAHSGTAPAVAASRYVRRWLLLSDALLIGGLVVAALTSRTTQLAGLGPVPAGTSHLPVVLGAALIAAAGVVRSALLPASRWLPETAEAPSPVSALLHAGLVNAVGVVSLLVWPLMSSAAVVRVGLLVVGAATAVVATAQMRTRPDVKGRLAASTSSQMGYLAVEVGLGLPVAVLAHVVGHGLWKAGLFLGAGGAVDRVRAGGAADPAEPQAAGRGPWRAVGALAAVAVVAVVLAQLPGGLPPLLTTPAEAAPLLLATLAAAVALAGGARWLPVLLAVAAYVLGLRLLGEALADVAHTVSFGWVGDTVVVVLLTAAALVLAAVDARARAGRLPSLSSRVAWSSLLPVQLAAGGRVRDAWRLRGELRVLAQTPASSTTSLPRVPAVASQAQREEIRGLAAAAAAVVAPAWPLAAFVASNPLAGLEGLPFADALDVASRTWTTPSLRAAAAAPTGEALRATWSRHLATFVTARALADSEWGCATPASPWRTLQAESGHVARALRRPATAQWLCGLPADPTDALAALLQLRPGWGSLQLSRLLARDPGWAAHVAWRRREGRAGGDVAELLAVRLALDILLAVGDDGVGGETAAVVDLTSAADADRSRVTGDSAVPALDLTSLEAAEEQWRGPVLTALADRAAAESAAAGGEPAQPMGQLVTCIDVRSERLRRHLEASGPWETLGAAGFFGVTLEHTSASGAQSARCPALVQPSLELALPHAARVGSGGGLAAVSAAPVVPFALAEASGWVTAVGTVRRTFAPGWDARELPSSSTLRPAPEVQPEGLDGSPLATAAAVDLAAGFLASIGLRRVATVLVLCGHTGHVSNNPHVAAYDCGACGGWSGADNARAMAGLLNATAVREGLAGRGIDFAPGAQVLAAVHDTTADVVTVLTDPPTPEARTALSRLLRDLDRACDGVRAERARLLPDVAATGDVPVTAVLARTVDWAQPRPEWGLAGNAAFVIGPRRLTRGLDLEGRVFLQSYEPDEDADGSVLTALLTAPMVVAQWINSQYWAATVAPDLWGAGDKTTHNAIAPAGAGRDTTGPVTAVLSGAHGDVRMGLPWQSVLPVAPAVGGASSGGAPALGRAGGHEALRLLVVVTATPEAVDHVLAQEESVRRLVAGAWLSLAVIDPRDGRLHRWSDGEWLPWSAQVREEARTGA